MKLLMDVSLGSYYSASQSSCGACPVLFRVALLVGCRVFMGKLGWCLEKLPSDALQGSI